MVNDLAPLYALIKMFEGCKLTPYRCPAQVWTAGWGSTGADVIPGQPWTQEYADLRLRQEAEEKVAGVLKLCPNLKGKQLCAIADFAYNCGLGALRSSTLRKRINANDTDGVVTELMKWTKGGGKVLKGLVKRRAAEAKLYFEGEGE